jgi:hypothetical protein
MKKMLGSLLLVAYAVQAAWDCLCTLVTVFPAIRDTCTLFKMVYGIYPSLFVQACVREDPQSARLLIYWIASGSLVRVAACIFMDQGSLLAVALICCFEILVLENEAFTVGSMYRRKARLMSIYYGLMAAASLLACLLTYMPPQQQQQDHNTTQAKPNLFKLR